MIWEITVAISGLYCILYLQKSDANIIIDGDSYSPYLPCLKTLIGCQLKTELTTIYICLSLNAWEMTPLSN
jgi:hypothetical protein